MIFEKNSHLELFHSKPLRKGKNARYQQKASFSGSLTVGIVWLRVNPSAKSL